MADERLEFALLAWRDDGRWRISQLPDDATTDIGVVLDALRAQQVDGGALAMLVRVKPDILMCLTWHVAYRSKMWSL